LKYEALKLPIENGEFWPVENALNRKPNKKKTNAKQANRAMEKEKEDIQEGIQEEMPEIVDATPTEARSNRQRFINKDFTR